MKHLPESMDEVKQNIRRRILEDLKNTDSPLHSVVYKLVVATGTSWSIPLIAQVLEEMFKQNEIVVSGFTPNLLSPRDIEVRIRRTGNSETNPGATH